ncbi:MAG: phosphatidate cytidylyltransferase [Chloroflexota bacterium]
MRQRLVSAAVLVPVVLVVFLAGQPWLTLGIAALAAAGGWEATRLLTAAGLPAERALVVASPAIAVVGLGLLTLPEGAALAFVGIVIVLAGMLAFRLPDVRDGFRAWMGTAFGALYVSLLAFLAGILAIAPPMGPGAPLHGVLDPGRIWVLVLVATVWTFDSLAYLSGRTFRRGRFFPHISPNKTMSGVIGGTIAAIVVAGVLVWAVGGGPIGGMVLGLVIAIAAQSGDLAESMLKRAAGANSGSLIQGTGASSTGSTRSSSPRP